MKGVEMVSKIAEKIFKLGLVRKHIRHGVAVSEEIDKSLANLYKKIEENPIWKESLLSAFKMPGVAIYSAEELANFSFGFSFGMRSAFPSDLCNEIGRWTSDEETPLGKIINGEDSLCRYEIVPLALYNYFIPKD